LKIEVQPAQINGVERVKAVCERPFNCIVRNLKRISKFRRYPPPGKILWTPMLPT